MEYRPLHITVVSADDIKNVKLLSKMDVYVEASIAGYPQSRKRTFVDKNCGTKPKWNFRMEFIVDEPYLTRPGMTLLFQLMAESTLSSDKLIGTVTVPIHELYQASSSADRTVQYPVQTASGKPKGTLKFSYRFGEKFTQQVDQAVPKHRSDEPVTAYPAAGAYPPPQYGAHPMGAYPPPPPQYGYGYHQAPPPGYGYPPAGYGYKPQKPKKSGMGGLGLGLGAGLLGGLLVGEMASDIGDAAAYADGYGDAMDDMGDFDF